MEISKGFVAVVAAASIAAGAGVTWLATSGPAASRPEPATVSGSVEQSEALVTEPAASPATGSVAGPVTAAAADTPVAAPVTRTTSRSSRRVRRESAPEPVREIATAAPLSPPTVAPLSELPPAPAVLPDPPAPRFEELEVAADAVLGLQIESSISSERAQIEDLVAARVTREVRVGERVAIPAGSRVEGEVTMVERGGRMRERARLGVRFTSVVLADGTRVPIETETIYRDGDPPSGESTAKIGGGAIGGAIIGGILGGAKGAIIGGSAGAGAGTAAVLAGGRNPATLPSGTPVTVRIVEPVVVTVER